MPKLRLTAAAVEKIRPPKTGRAEYFDAAWPGFGIRVSDKGRRTWFAFYRVHKRLVRATLGTYPAMSLQEARKAASAATEAAARGEDLRQARRRAQANTVEAAVADWLRRDQSGNRSHDEVKRLFEREVLPRWKGRPLSTIGRRDCLDIVDRVADRGAVTSARRLHSHLHRMLRWSVGRGLIDANPMADLPKPGQEVRRDRVLSDAELVEIWRAADAIGWPFGPAVQLLILTAARREEIGAATWREVDQDEAVIRLAAARTKTGEPRLLPLSPPALATLESLPRVAPAKGAPGYIFTTTGATPVSGWSRAKALIDKAVLKARREAAEAAGEAAQDAEPMPPWRFHDLRRTAATGLQKLGHRLEIIEAVLGHVSGSRAGIVGIYQRHSYEAEKRAALEVWARHVAGLIEGRPAADNVVQLAQAR